MIKEINKILKLNSYETTDDYNEDVCVIDVTSKQQRTEIAGRIVKKLKLCGVMQQRELLIDFLEWYNEDAEKTPIIEDEVDLFIKEKGN